MIDLEVVTPERQMLKASCESVNLPGLVGEYEVLEGHTPMLTGLKAGILRYTSNGGPVRIMVAEGFAEVGPSHVTVLCEAAAFSSEVDIEAEKKLIEKLQEERSGLAQDDVKEFKRVEAELERSAARIRLQ